MQNDIFVLDKNNEQVLLSSVIRSTIEKVVEKNAISTSKGKDVVSAFLDNLMFNDDPFLKALVTLGGEKSVNSLGVLLFVAFQLGVNFGSETYKFSLDTPSET